MWQMRECSNCQNEIFANPNEVDVFCDKCEELVNLRIKVEQYEKSFSEYTDTLNQTRRKRDEVKGKLEVALKTIKEQKEEIKQLKLVMHKYHKYATQDFAKEYGIKL